MITVSLDVGDVTKAKSDPLNKLTNSKIDAIDNSVHFDELAAIRKFILAFLKRSVPERLYVCTTALKSLMVLNK